MRISLHIERLVLDGLPFEDRHVPELRAAAERELTRLLTERGLSPWISAGAQLTQVTGPAIDVDSRPRPAELGRQIAGAVYGGIAS